MEVYRVLTALVVVAHVASYRHYQDLIPNGDVVPHPCKPNFFWRGLGHINPLGGGPRNPFGRDFARFHSWTQELCRMDSDGDGLTNGEELGDPRCVWSPGQTPEITNVISHPGICSPWGSPQCEAANRNVSCETGEFVCDGLDAPDVFTITLRFPPTKVPPRETSYMCFTFELDMLDPDTDYHLIATEPVIDNANVMHHITLSGCNAASASLTEPALCNMAETNCQNSIGLWTLGMAGECVYREAGFKIGPKTGVVRLNMQHHWTNPELRTDYVDSSGMILYLTKELRPYNAGYFLTGENDLEIPPGRDRWVVESTCSERCTRNILSGPIQIMTGLNHMHYLGYQQNVEHFRSGMKLRDLTPDDYYSYDNPIVHEYNPPVEMRIGDELLTTCVFKSTSRSKTTFFGEGTFDEMCYGIFTYFPVENLKMPACVTHGDLEFCDYNMEALTIYDCNIAIFFNSTERDDLFKTILSSCNSYGTCRQECPAAIAQIRQHPCFSDQLFEFTTDTLRQFGTDPNVVKFLGGLHSCECPRVPDDYVLPSSAGKLGTTTVVFLTSILLKVGVF